MAKTDGCPVLNPRRYVVALLLGAAGLILIFLGVVRSPAAPPVPTATVTPFPTPTATPNLPGMFPTRTPAAGGGSFPTPAPRSPTPVPLPFTDSAQMGSAATADGSLLARPLIPPPPIEERFGVTVPMGFLAEASAAGLRFGSHLNWGISAAAGENFWQMIRLSERGIYQSWDEIAAVLEARPGSTWLIGNEPDAALQDNVTPGRYAELYHQAYIFIKERDPQARVAIGGVSQPTPLRRQYLELVLASYRERYGAPMPIDIWNVHAFVLREERGSWGAGIPPGLTADTGQLVEIDQADDFELLKRQLIDFRIWMAEQGYGNRPLVISEYGILMPPEYGFDEERVARFLRDSFNFFTTATHPAGYAADGGRLVQWWFWYSVYDSAQLFPAGNLYDPESGRLTASGGVFAEYPR